VINSINLHCIMSNKNRRGDSTSSTFTNDDIEATVSKAVEAGVQVLKTEFTKLFEDTNSRIRKVEDSLADYISDTTINDRISTLESALHSLKSELMSVKQLLVENRDAVGHAPRVPDGVNNAEGLDAAGIAEDSRDSATGCASFAGLTRRLAQDPGAFRNVARKNRLIVGASSYNKRLKAVMTKRNVDIFISRLHPETSSHELVDCV